MPNHFFEPVNTNRRGHPASGHYLTSSDDVSVGGVGEPDLLLKRKTDEAAVQSGQSLGRLDLATGEIIY